MCLQGIRQIFHRLHSFFPSESMASVSEEKSSDNGHSRNQSFLKTPSQQIYHRSQYKTFIPRGYLDNDALVIDAHMLGHMKS